MKKLLLLAVVLLLQNTASSQATYKSFKSSRLGETRELKIQLPRNYDSNVEKRYPLVLVLDGDYLFEPMAGNVDILSYWHEIPETIVVGVNQLESRMEDTQYDDLQYLPSQEGAAFFEFLGMELLPFLDENYRTAKFLILVGHDYTANFINYYLLKKEPLFHAYVNLSPDLAPEMENRLYEALSIADSRKWFYLATASEDVPQLKKSAELLHRQLQSIENPNLHYAYSNIENANHYSLIAHAIPKALEHIFKAYSPVKTFHYENEIIISMTSPYDYLTEKYATIEEFYGLDIPVRINDFLKIGKALELHQNWDDLEKLGELAKEEYPHSMLGTYYLARSYEANGNTKRAMRTYQRAFEQEEIAFLTVDFMLKKAEQIKEDFGY